MFVTNQSDDTLSAVNIRTCDGTVTTGCANTPPTVQAGSNRNPGYTGFPNTMTLLQDSDTAYMTNVGGETGLGDQGRSMQCREHFRLPYPSVERTDRGFLAAIDPATNTIYAGNNSLPEIDVINGAS